jgi:D-alanyl-D-alanine carboxypeptidase (penicillin-binding protein 5/6)
MKKHRLLSLLMAVCLLFVMIPHAAAEDTVFMTNVKSALLVEQTTGQVLYSLDPDERNYPASLTKIMTCLLVLENGNLNDTVTVSSTALENLHEAGSTAGLMVGEELSLLNALYCVMISSANEACNVVAEHIAGSIDAFVEMMNTRATELGCTDTHFANTHGLHDENHYSTAQDLLVITQEALKHDMFRIITNTAYYQVPATNLSEPRDLYTTNKLITEGSSNSFYYSKASGIKTGFTTPAGRCLISTADNGNIKLLAVIMGAETIYDEATGSYIQRNFPECINLFEHGFKNFKMEAVLTKLYPVAEIPVNMAAGSDTVALSPVQEIRSTVPADFDSSELELNVTLYSPSVDAPVEAGTVLGRVTVTLHGEELGTVELAAITSLSRSEITHQAEETKDYVEHNWWKWLLGCMIAAVIIFIIIVIFVQVRRRQERRRKIAERRRMLLEQRQRNLDQGDGPWTGIP